MDYTQFENIPSVYKITCKITNKIYIGSSVKLRYRVSRHINDLKKNEHASKYLQNAFNKYGDNNFEIIVLEEYKGKEISKIDLLKREQYYLDIFKPYLKENGYNTCPKATSPNIGHHSEERKLQISLKLRGRFVSEETRKKIGDGNRNKIMLKESNEKNRQKHIGVKQSEESIDKRAKNYAFIGPDNIIYKGRNLKRFAEEHNLHRFNLNKVLSGERKTHHGFRKYEE